MTKYFFKFKKILFLAHFPIFWGKKSFSKKLGCHAQLHKGFWHYVKIEENPKIQFHKNGKTDVRREGWTNLFHRVLPATARGLTTTIVVD